MTAPRPKVEVVVAAAGAGKTTRICGAIAEAVGTVAPERLLATTFTNKAAAELTERARAALFEAGEADLASRLLGARIGTVNAVCGRMVAERALELGRSPRADVIPEESFGAMFSAAASDAIEAEADALGQLAERLGWTEARGGRSAPDWRETVRRLVAAGRANGLGPEGLRESARRSIESFGALLGEPADGEVMDARLLAAVRDALAEAPMAPSSTVRSSLTVLRRVSRHRDAAAISWPDWARLAGVKAAKKDGETFNDALDTVRAAAAESHRHPRLRADAEAFIRRLFACAAAALAAYDAFKARRGLVDFTDQETLALQALDHPAAGPLIGESVERVFVDEFQDSSPLQVALFGKLAELAGASTWVGDPKQAIYAFRDADSRLTQAVFAGVAAEAGAPPDRLAISYRSRAGIVDFVNDAFGPALDAMGLPAAEHAFKAAHRGDGGIERPPLEVWPVAGKNNAQRTEALAEAVAAVVAAPEAHPVGLKDGGTRPLRPGDVGVLCRSNNEVAAISEALTRLGVPVAADRGKLADTPHVALALAACRRVADRRDRLAAAELARLFAETPDDDAWLEAAADEDPDAALDALVPVAPALEALRARQGAMTPAETLDAVLALPDVIERAARWGDAAQRRDDLEALRGAFRRAEAEAAAAAGVAPGLGTVCDAVAAAEPPRPARIDGAAVEVLTYHRAKGLEWPLVVLTGLGKGPRPRLFDEPVAETDGAVDWRRPLAGRWLRFWPWPYAGQSKNLALADAAEYSEIGRRAARDAREEAVRLLYVGMTRARDHLVLAVEEGKDATAWLDLLSPDPSAPQVALPAAPGHPIRVGGVEHPTAPPVAPAAGAAPPAPEAPRLAPPHEALARPPLHLRPSDGGEAEGWRLGPVTELGPRLSLAGTPDMAALGEALHAVFAAEASPLRPAEREARAARILARWDVRAVDPAAALAAADRLAAELARRRPGAEVSREVPVSARLGERLVRGRVDLLLRDAEGFDVIDHKSFPGGREAALARAVEHAPQLALYAQALEIATGRPCRGVFVHLPVSGLLVELDGSPR